VQRIVQPPQHVVEAEQGALALDQIQARGDPWRGVREYQGTGAIQFAARFEQIGNGGEGIVCRGHAVLVGRAVEAGWRVAAQQLVVGLRALGPGAQRGEVERDALGRIAARVERLAAHGVVEPGFDGRQVGEPEPPRARLGFVAPRERRLQHGAQVGHLGERLAVQAQIAGRLAQQGTQRELQRLRVLPPAREQGGGVAIQRQAVEAPVVAHGFGEQFAVVRLDVLDERMPAVERVLGQHALGPAVDGVHGGFVHPLRGQLQLPRGGGAGVRVRVFADQCGEEGIRVGLSAEHARRLGQARADAVAQLGGGGLGEGEDQDLRGQQRRARAVAQHQAQVQRGDRPGLAGARAGLDQAHAVQRQAQRIERSRRGAHASSPECSASARAR
jgi:hypothetical protein